MICPIEYRYGRDRVKDIFSESKKYDYMLKVEVALVYSYFKLGLISKQDFEIIEKAAMNVNIDRIKAFEAQTKHDVMALVLALTEQAGNSGKYIHLGATSNDIIDTSTAIQFKEFIKILKQDLLDLENVLISKSNQYKNTIMLGRTHGQWALPITFGLKLAVYLDEIHRHLTRVKESEKRVIVGKMLGAVGTGAGFEPYTQNIQKIISEYLGINLDFATTQVVERDRYIEFISIISNIATTLEKIATEIRNLQRPEIGEVSEYFDKEKQVGSSTMAHKQNPIVSENICSLARIIRGFIVPMHESAILWHERDLSNSASERFIIPHSCVLIDDILIKMKNVLDTLIVNEDVMHANLENARYFVMDEPIIVALTKKGLGRQQAHEFVRLAAMQNKRIDEALLNIPEISKIITKEELESLTIPERYLGESENIIETVIKNVLEDRKESIS
ncbi:MAG: adenylosuccinate lyase [Thermoplasmata archaeon]